MEGDGVLESCRRDGKEGISRRPLRFGSPAQRRCEVRGPIVYLVVSY